MPALRRYRRARRVVRRRRLPMRRSFRYRRFHNFRRFGARRGRKLALRRSGNNVRYTAKNNLNVFMTWPVAPDTSKVRVTNTPVVLTLARIVYSNRQWARNIQDYQWIKFNYVAVKVTDVCHVGHDYPATYGEPKQYISTGVSSIAGKIPVNCNWDLEQDFTFEAGHEGSIDPEAFAQHPGTKQIRPDSKRPVTFLWRIPTAWRQFISTDIVKNSPEIDTSLGAFFQDVMSVKNIRAPITFFLSIPNFWSSLLPSVPDPGAAIKTYVRLNVYLGCTFRGRRLMNRGQDFTIDTCLPEVIPSDAESPVVD